MRIERVRQADEELVEALRRLLPQLSPDAPTPSLVELMEVVATPGTSVLVARDEHGAVAGSLTLVLYRTPIGLHAVVHDVVVDETTRGQGVGEALSREAIRLAQLAGAGRVELTSRPHREAAHRLYERLGFRRHETNVYRLPL
ncbi:MAG: GNAT family N-acetyltransferase [Gaiellaceae bacterium]